MKKPFARYFIYDSMNFEHKEYYKISKLMRTTFNGYNEKESKS